MDISVLDQLIYQRFIQPTVGRIPQYVGVEFELPLVNLKQEPVSFSVVHALVDAFLERFDFIGAARDEEGRICSARSRKMAMTSPLTVATIHWNCPLDGCGT